MAVIHLIFTKPPFTDKQIRTTVTNITRIIAAEITDQKTKKKRRFFHKPLLQVSVDLYTNLTVTQIDDRKKQLQALKVLYPYKLAYR